MENNIKLSHMSHWKTVPYKQIDNFRDFYYEDKSNNCYYMDWDRILRYHKATGYDGIEIAPWDLGETMELKSVVCSMAAMIHTLHPNMMK